jgi:putative transposase
MPAASAASSLGIPCAIPSQNRWSSERFAAGGRPGDGNDARPERWDRRFRGLIATSYLQVLRRPFESAQYVSIKYTERLAEAGIEPSVGSVGDSYDNALAETINGLYKAEVIHRRGPWRNFEAVEFATLDWVDWFNNRRLLEPIGFIPPAEAEERYFAMLNDTAMAA